MIVTVNTIGNGDPSILRRDWTAPVGPVRPDLPLGVNWTHYADNGSTMRVEISAADAEREDVKAAIARAAQ